MAQIWSRNWQKSPKTQKFKNPLCCSLDTIHLKVCTNFHDNLVTQCLKKVVPVEKNDHFFNYGISYTFCDMCAKYPSRYCA